MKIEHSNASLFSSHAKHDEVVESESLKMWNKPEDNPELVPVRGDKLVLSDIYKSLKQNKVAHELDTQDSDSSIDPKLIRIIRALEMLTGHKINTSFLRKLSANGEGAPSDTEATEGAKDEIRPLGWGIDYNYQRTEIHEESLKFSAHGNVKTADGKSIDFAMAMSMKSSTHISESLSFKAGDV